MLCLRQVARRGGPGVVGTLLDTIEYSPIKIELLSRLGMQEVISL